MRSATHSSGFSLIETLIALGVLCGAVVTLASLCLTSVGLMIAARHRSYAVVLARAKLEELLAAAAAGQPVAGGSDALDGEGRVTSEGLALYVRRWQSLTAVTHPTRLELCEVAVTTKAAAGIHGAEITLATLLERQP